VEGEERGGEVEEGEDRSGGEANELTFFPNVTKPTIAFSKQHAYPHTYTYASLQQMT